LYGEKIYLAATKQVPRYRNVLSEFDYEGDYERKDG
jgi:hypothetical protein